MTEMMTMDNAPLWLNMVIWMAAFWMYFLAGFVPAFYIAITKLFGMPILQRWSSEVVIMLYPTKAKFGKITQQYEPYIRYGKGVYWLANPLQPEEYAEPSGKVEERMNKIRTQYEELIAKKEKTKKEVKEIERLLKEQRRQERRVLTVKPVNQIHVFTHAVNQPVYSMERRTSKVDEILNNDARPKKIKSHGIWLLQNPRLHFHRHYRLVVSPDNTTYILEPVKERQQFSIGFWHSIGISLTQKIETKSEAIEGGESETGGGLTKLLLQPVTTNTVLQRMKEVQDYQNFSASRAYMILFKRRAPLEENFWYWLTGSINPLIFIVLGGAIAAIAVMFMFLHGNGPQSQTQIIPGVGSH